MSTRADAGLAAWGQPG